MIDSATKIPIITVDGPSGVGKGTISALLASHLNWHYLDSGALYRLTALACVMQDISFEEEDKVAKIAENLAVTFLPQGAILLQGKDVEEQIRTAQAGVNASKVAVLPKVREALLIRQKAFLQVPGLIADGRDMGTTVFPSASLKVFLTASPEQRAKRRYKQLIEKGNSVKIADLVEEIRERDERDMNRSASPLKPAQDAHIVDTSELTINEVYQNVMQLYEERL
jgi:cytidylate kinase